MDIFNCNNGSSGRLLKFFIVSLLGLGVVALQAGDAMAKDAAGTACMKHTGDDKSAAYDMCWTCLTVPGLASTPQCKDYIYLKDVEAPPEPLKKIDPAAIDKEVSALKQHCDREAVLNCQCQEKEYRANRMNGLNIAEAALKISSDCVSEEKIKAYEYAQCVNHSGMWNKIVAFETYCGCVANHVATETKKGWFAGAEANPNNLRLSATEVCEYGKQEKLSPEAAKERYKKYGDQDPVYDASAWQKLP